MTCERCNHWTVQRVTKYGDGSTIENWRAASGKGACDSLGIETDALFACNRFFEGSGDHVEIVHKHGAPWQHFKMIPCPDCGGLGDGGRGHRCAGTGLVRLYDDGHVGDEQTRMHPKEKPLPANCAGCGLSVDRGWAHCPSCGKKLWIEPAEPEIVDDGLGPLPAAQEPLT